MNDPLNRRLFRWILDKAGHSPNLILPRWAIVVGAILMPIKYLSSKLGGDRYYDFIRDEYKFGGARFSATFLMEIANGTDFWFRSHGQDEYGAVIFEIKEIRKHE